jgi:hypothetical protein
LVHHERFVRVEMMRLADDLHVEPTRISFVAAARSLVQEWYWNADTPPPGAHPQNGSQACWITRASSSCRHADRAVLSAGVKIKMSNYARKQPASSPSRQRPK